MAFVRAPWFVVLALACALSGCRTGKTDKWQLYVVTDVGANRNSAIRLDFVLVYDVTTLAQLPKTASEWFAHKQAILDGAPAGLEVLPLELPPALVRWVTLPVGVNRAIAVRVYAGYQDERGQHPIDLTGIPGIKEHSRLPAIVLRLRMVDFAIQSTADQTK